MLFFIGVCWSNTGELVSLLNHARMIVMAIYFNQKPTSETMHRVSVIGETGSGKSTLCMLLSKVLELPFVELDKLEYHARENKISTPLLLDLVVNELDGKDWVTECHFSRVRKAIRDVIWSQTDTIVWIDYPLSLVLYRVARRAFNRIIFNHNNKMYWKEGTRSKLAFKRELGSILNILRRYFTSEGKKIFKILISNPTYAHINIVRLSSPRDTYEWLSQLSQAKYKRLLLSTPIY